MEYEKTETERVTEFTTYVASPPPQAGQDLRCVVTSEGKMTITLTDAQLGVFVWEGIVAAAPLIYDLLGHVIADQAGTLDDEEV